MRHVVQAIALMLLATASAEAQQVAGTFDQLRVLVKPGDTLTVIDGAGTRSRGKLTDMSMSSLELDIAGSRRLFRDTDVNIIEKRGADSLRNGALIGFLTAGAIFGPAIGALTGDWGAAIAGGLVYSGIGAGIGVGIDALIESERVIYAAARPSPITFNIAPTPRRSGKGVVVSLNLSR